MPVLLNFGVTSRATGNNWRFALVGHCLSWSKHLTTPPGMSRFISCVGDPVRAQRPKLVLLKCRVYLGRLIGEAAHIPRDQAKIQFSQL